MIKVWIKPNVWLDPYLNPLLSNPPTCPNVIIQSNLYKKNSFGPFIPRHCEETITMETSHTSQQPVIGVLLVHGLNGSRRDLAELETVLQDHGILTTNMLLP